MAGAPPVDYGAYRAPRLPDQPTLDPAVAAQATGGGYVAAAEGAELARRFLQKRFEARAETDVSDALTRTSDELETLRLDLEKDPDTAGRHEKFKSKAEAIRDKEMSGLDYQPARDAFKTRFNRVSGALTTQLKTAAFEEEKQVGRLKLDDNNDDLLNKALFAKAPAEREAYLANVRANIDGAVKTGLIGATGAHQRLRAGLGKFEVAVADGMIRQNPAAAMKALQDPEQFKYLDAPARAKLLAQGQSRIESLGVQARAEWQHDFQLYQQARAAGQPVDAKIETQLVARARRVGGAAFQHLNTTKQFYDRVDTYAGMPLPELREASVQLGQGSLVDKQVGRAVDRIITQDTREKTKLLQEGLKEFKTFREVGEQAPNLPNLLELAAEVGGPTMRESVEATDRFYARVNYAKDRFSADGVRQRITMITEDRRAAQGGTLTVEDIHEVGALHKALEVKEREAKADPAGYVMKYYPTVAESFVKAGKSGDTEDFGRAADALLAAQQREGIAPQLLAKDAAVRLEAQLNDPDVGKRLAAVDAAKAAFGDRHWPLVKQQLNTGKDLPPETEVLASLPPGAVLDRARIVEAFRLKEDEWSKQLGSEKATLDDFVRAKGADVMRSFNLTPGGSPHADAFMVTARRLAYLNRSSGQSASQAAANAWDEAFNRHWTLVGNVRIPKIDGQPVADPARVAMSQRIVVGQLGKLDLLDPETPGLANLTPTQRRAMLARAAQSFGYWVSDAKESGGYLFAGPNQPVRWSDGSPVFLPFEAAQQGNLESSLRRVNRRASVRRIDDTGREEVIEEDTGARQ